MAKAKASNTEPIRDIRPALTPEAREKQMISLAVDLAEKQLLEGTASSQVITHYLKLGTMREQAEVRRIEQEIELQKAKIKAIDNADEIKKLYKDALDAMRLYSGHGRSMDDDEDEYDED